MSFITSATAKINSIDNCAELAAYETLMTSKLNAIITKYAASSAKVAALVAASTNPAAFMAAHLALYADTIDEYTSSIDSVTSDLTALTSAIENKKAQLGC